MRKKFIVDGKEISMRKGKMIAQGSHACLKAILDLARVNPNESSQGSEGNEEIIISLNAGTALQDWINGRFTKICVSVDTEEELMAVYNKAKNKGLICSLITDAGLTEFNGVPTVTCCAIGPAWSDDVDEITGKLQLL